MAYVDPTPDGLMPAPIALSRKPPREQAAAPISKDARSDGQRVERIALIAIALIFAGLVFALAIVTIANLGIALVVTALTLLPLASLIVTPSGISR